MRMIQLRHFELSTGEMRTEDQPNESSTPHYGLVALVNRGHGELPGASRWSCQIGQLLKRDGIPEEGAADLALYFKYENMNSILALVGVCCWAASASPKS
jgi:hypothetical protein